MSNAPARRQFVQFLMFKVDPAWRGQSAAIRSQGKSIFADVLEEWSFKMVIRSYSLVGIRGDSDFFLWLIADRLEDFQSLRTQLFRTPLGPWLSTPYSYLSSTKRSVYVDKFEGESSTIPRGVVVPGRNKYLFVYPFVKTRAWYALSLKKRQVMMDEHIRVGRQFPDIRINTTYSFGLDDQEFIVAFEGDNPHEFVDLVMALRETKASLYTLKDVPTFTGIAGSVRDILEALGGATLPSSSDQPETGDTPALAATSTARPAPTDGFYPVCRPEDIPTIGGKLVIVAGEQIALFKIGQRLHAISNRCSHSRGPLVDGTVHGDTLTCPWHGAQFDLETGTDQGLPARGPVPVYHVKIEDGWVKVGPQKTR